MKIVLLASIGLALGVGIPAAAQQAAAPPAAAAPACPPGTTCTPQPLPSSTLGLFPFPAKQQTKEQQLQDEQACYAWAKDQTAIDPATVKANPDSAAKASQEKMAAAATGAAVAGAAKGAAAGAVISAAGGGDAGHGAGAGAAAGAIAGRRAKKQAVAQAGAQGAAANQAQVDELMNTFKKAFTACITGKGYTVS
jgi:hypothetical protein